MIDVSTAQLAKAATKAVMDYRNDPGTWVADYLFPRVPVTNVTGYLPRFNSTNQKDIEDAVGVWSPTPRVDFGLSSTAFECLEHKRRLLMPEAVKIALRDAGDVGTMLASVAGQALVVDEALRVRRERAIAVKLVDTTNSVTSQSAPSTRWDAAGGNPALDVATAIGTIDDAINHIPQYGLCTRDVGLFLRRYVAALRAGGGSASMASLQEVADYLGLKEVRLINAGYDSTGTGSSRTGAKVIAANKFWVFYKPDNLSAFAPTWACTPTLQNVPTVEVFAENSQMRANAVEVYDWRVETVVDKTACVYIATPLT